jgi:hypothetical protein
VTVAELIERLRELPPELPVYFRDTDGDWLPCQPVDVQTKHFHAMGWMTNRPGYWCILVDNEAGPANGVSIG